VDAYGMRFLASSGPMFLFSFPPLPGACDIRFCMQLRKLLAVIRDISYLSVFCLSLSSPFPLGVLPSPFFPFNNQTSPFTLLETPNPRKVTAQDVYDPPSPSPDQYDPRSFPGWRQRAKKGVPHVASRRSIPVLPSPLFCVLQFIFFILLCLILLPFGSAFCQR